MYLLKETFGPYCRLSDHKRIEWIDLAKGICIFLVVANHIFYYNCVFLEQLRMPLYFILSGLFFKDYGGFCEFMLKKTNKILIPFIFFYLSSQLLYWVMRLVVGQCDISSYPDFLVLFRVTNYFNNPIWFLLCLYEVNILYYVIQHYTNSRRSRYVIIIIAGFIGAALSYTPLYLGAMLTALPFFYLGTVLKDSFVIKCNERKIIQALCGCVVVAILTILPSYIPVSKITFYLNDVQGSYLVALICSSLGVISVLLICKCIRWLPLFSFIGRYSIIVLCVHMVYISILNHFSLLTSCQYGRFYELVIVTILSWLTIPVAIKLIPWFVAQKDLIRSKV
jgi:fucose 4-O-acetylase-like acetyltransferase